VDEALLIYASPEQSADLFRAIPAGIIDPFLYVEAGGRRAATVSVLDADKVRALGVEIVDPYSLGRDDLLKAGRPDFEIEAEISLRACRALGEPLGVHAQLQAGARRPAPSWRASAAPSVPPTRPWPSPPGWSASWPPARPRSPSAWRCRPSARSTAASCPTT